MFDDLVGGLCTPLQIHLHHWFARTLLVGGDLAAEITYLSDHFYLLWAVSRSRMQHERKEQTENRRLQNKLAHRAPFLPNEVSNYPILSKGPTADRKFDFSHRTECSQQEVVKQDGP